MEELKNEIGTIEQEKQTLQPAKVIIKEIEITPIESAKSKKVTCKVKHPDKEELIKISSASFLIDKSVQTKGLWYNQDKDGKIQKGSAVANFLVKNGCKTLQDLQGKEIETELDGNWLVFKCY